MTTIDASTQPDTTPATPDASGVTAIPASITAARRALAEASADYLAIPVRELRSQEHDRTA